MPNQKQPPSLSLPYSHASLTIIGIRVWGVTTSMTLVATVSSSLTIRGQSPSNEILRFHTKVRPYFPTVVSEPKLLKFDPN